MNGDTRTDASGHRTPPGASNKPERKEGVDTLRGADTAGAHRRIGEYSLTRRIGVGGMGEVWLGERHAFGGARKAVAIKLIAASKSSSERHQKMFAKEAQLSMLLAHSNIVQVFDTGKYNDQHMLAMEWLDGLSLAQLLEHLRFEGRMVSCALAGYVLGEILKALSYAHKLRHEGKELKIIHRDISPHNILVSVSGEVKLTDFGVARIAGEKTSGNLVKGKVCYMAPEHFCGRSNKPTVDIFGAGAVLHEMLEGDKFRQSEDDTAELRNSVITGKTPCLTREGIPKELRELCMSMLHPDDSARVQCADAALSILDRSVGREDASRELGEIVRSATGVRGPRSGQTRPRTTSEEWVSRDEVGTELLSGTHKSTSPNSVVETLRFPAVETTSDRGAGRLRRMKTLGIGAGIAAVAAIATHLYKAPRVDARTLASGIVPSRLGVSVALAGQRPVEQAQDRIGLSVEQSVTVSPTDQMPTPPEPDVRPPRVASAMATGNAQASTDAAKKKAAQRSTRAKKRSAAPGPEQPKQVPVTLKLRLPLRTIFVSVDGGAELSVAPMARVDLSPGKHKVRWRQLDGAYVDGGTVTIPDGGGTVRISVSGARVE